MAKWERLEPRNYPKDFAVTVEDDLVKAIEFTLNGQSYRLVGEWSNLKLFAPAKPAMIKKHRLSGEPLPGMKIEELFDDIYGARDRKDELQQSLTSDVELTIEEVEVPEEA